MISGNKKTLDYYLEKGPYKTDKLNVCSFKFYADGALGSRGACLIEPYSDVVGHHHGLMINEKKHFEKYASLLYQKGFQMNTHCIGDSANRMILEVYAKTLQSVNDKRWRIEHAQVIHPTDFKYFKDYTIIPSVQTTHATSDMYWAKERLGTDRIKGAYAYQDLLQQNGIIALGTDFPVEGINPLNTFYAAVFRKDNKGYPENGYQMENALTRQEALKGMTIWAAISNFEESEKGSLEIGKAADFVILNNDIMITNEENILKVKVVETFINGENVYSLKK
jgi:predicted amidohydrolase YtcJ